ncbi:MAG: SDR family NAD(P)-dependent oxidoreductase [Acidimicrobiales bacterium]
MNGPRRLAVVTGAGSGIGRATAHRLAADGALVVAADVDQPAAEVVAKEVDGIPAGVDVADGDAVAALASDVLDAHGVPDLLVNCAGVGMSGRFLDTGAADWDWIVSINLLGVVHCCGAFGRSMVARGSGHVVNVASGLAYTPRPTEPAYVTTKAAVLALSRCLRADWGPRGVGVSAVCPGVIDTPILRTTRLRGERADPGTVDRLRRLFARGHPPSLVADAIAAAVEHDRPIVTVGIEARLGRALHRLLPTRVADRAARTSILGL